MLVHNTKIFDRIQAFTKYARFVSQKFGVTVILDGTEAKTDGTTVYLPNIAALSEEEIDFLYCVLLHEIGHIRHSEFSKDIFKEIETDSHFSIFNALEDARIENAMMSEYAGASDVFTDLYHKFATDEHFIKRIFGFGPGDTTWLYVATIYAHYELLNLPTKLSIAQALGQNASKVYAFPFKKKLDLLLDSYRDRLHSTKDVLVLSKKVYNLLFSDAVDKSDANTIPAQENLVESTLEETEKLHKELEKQDSRLEALRQKIKKLRQNMAADRADSRPFSEQLKKVQADLDKVENTKDVFEDGQQAKVDLENSQRLAQLSKEKLRDKDQQVKELDQKVKDLEEKIAHLLAQKLQESDYKRKVQLNKHLAKLEHNLKVRHNKLTKISDIQKRLQEKLKTREDQVDRAKNKVQQLQDQASKIPTPLEELQKLADALEKQSSSISQQKSTIENRLWDKKSQMDSLQQELDILQGTAARGAREILKQIQEKCNQAGIPIDVSSTFQPIPGWDSANQVQQQFDGEASQQLGKEVVNGGMTGSNIRDILLLIEKGVTDLQQIDLADLFKKKHEVSKLDVFNDLTKVKNTQEGSKSDESVQLKGVRQHLPSTTQFDRVKISTVNSTQSLSKLKQSNLDDIIRVKRLMKKKMHYQKKLRFKGGQEEGGLDNRSVWKLASHTGEDIYEIPHPMKVNQVVASIALDISGSMEKKLTTRETLLKEMALILSEGLTECAVRHEICGYHAPVCEEMRLATNSSIFNRTLNSLETVVYKTFNDKNNQGIDNLEVQCTDNSDGESLKVIASRLLRERAKRKILFVVLDGKPFLSGSDSDLLDQDLKNTIEWLSINKIEIYALGLDPDVEKHFGSRFFPITSPSDLVRFVQDKLEG